MCRLRDERARFAAAIGPSAACRPPGFKSTLIPNLWVLLASSVLQCDPASAGVPRGSIVWLLKDIQGVIRPRALRVSRAMQNTVPKVLLLEDDALINLGMTEMIERMGYQVRSSMTVVDAFNTAKEDRPDVGVLDVNIGGTTSYVLAEWLHNQNVPIIFVTGYEQVAPFGRWRDYPVCRKPCKSEDLKALITKLLPSGQ
jgi:CheY-like chemotaxis protein